MKAVVLSLCFCNIGATILFTSVSHLNCPGGQIGQALRHRKETDDYWTFSIDEQSVISGLCSSF